MAEVRPPTRSRIVIIVLLAGVLPGLVTLVDMVAFGNAEHANEALHAGMEVVGACIALAVALLLSLRSAHEGVDGPTLWVIAALIVMGLFDGAHGLAPYGGAWSWLRHVSTLGGGMLFGLVWLPLPETILRRRRSFILGIATAAIACATAIILTPAALPAPWDAIGYTTPVKLANAAGGVGFVAAAVFFLRGRGKPVGSERLLFASLTMLFGAASLLFGFSERWGAEWWTWHAIRLAAYVVVIVAAWSVLVDLYRRVEDDARQLAAANRALEAEIAERRRAEADLQAHRARLEEAVATRTEELRANEALLRVVSETVEDAIYVKDVNSRLLMINPATERIVGKPAGEILGRTDAEIYDDPAIGAAILEHDRALVRDGRAQVFEETVDTPAGRRTFLSAKALWRNAEGQVIGIFGISRDITERRAAEVELEESRRKYQALIETTSDFIWETDALGRYVYCSPQMEELWGLKPEEMLGKTPFDMMPPDQREGSVQVYADMVRSPRPFNGLESQALDARGRPIFVETSGVPFFDSEGQLLGYRGITRDITARRQAEETLRVSEERLRRQATELAEANRLKDEFLSTLSHELRTPLSAILGWGSMLQKGGLDPAMAQAAYDAIVRNAHAQRQLIDDTLDVARIVTGRLRIDVRKTDLAGPLAAVLETIRPTAEAKGITIACQVDASLPALFADAARLRQILWNLLSNAVKFTPRGGSVAVSARRTDSQVEISVCDTGIGISTAFLPRVFDRFSQADGSAARRHGGLGLGLAIVRHLAELHGASVEAESPGEGHGSTFTIRFPVQPDLQPPAPDAPPEHTEGHGRAAGAHSLSGVRILLVDDDPDARGVVTVCLQGAGAEVTAADSSASGLAALANARFDVLVGDIGMPGEDGYSFMRQVRALPAESGGQVPALAVTAYARAEDRAAALSAGYQEHLAKPVTPGTLLRAVAALVRRQSVGRS